METLKKIFKNRIIQLSLAVIVGGVVTTLFLQEVIINKRESEARKEQQELKEQVSAQSSAIAELHKSLAKHQVVHKTKTTKPDGTIVETSTIETNTQITENIRAEEKAKYEAALAKREAELESKISELSIHKNPRRLDIFAGIDVRSVLKERIYSGGVNYTLWGPLTAGIIANSRGDIVPTIGIRF